MEELQSFDLYNGAAPRGLDDLGWTQLQLDRFGKRWKRLRLWAFSASHPELATVLGSGFVLTPSAPRFRERFEALKRMTVTAVYRPTILRVEDMSPGAFEKAMGVVELKAVVFELQLGGKPFSKDAVVSHAPSPLARHAPPPG